MWAVDICVKTLIKIEYFFKKRVPAIEKESIIAVIF